MPTEQPAPQPTQRSWYLDLHVHSRYAYATSRDLTLPVLDATARAKGLAVLGTGDATHPGWRAELAEQLVPAPEEGLWVRRGAGAGATRFLPSAEVNCTYRQGGRARRIHVLLLLPSLAAADAVARALEGVGADLTVDGRPTLLLSVRSLTELVLGACPDAVVLPAHAWTPWFGALGSKSGFDSLQECFGDLLPHVPAVETGLSADPAMAWRISALDDVAVVSASDAHSPSRLGREATRLGGEVSFPGVVEALRTGAPVRAGERAASRTRLEGTVEMHPQHGKYHLDGHRPHRVRMTPAESAAAGGRCPECGRPVTVGVLSRVEALADRPPGARPDGAPPFRSLLALDEVLAEALGVRPAAKRVAVARERLLAALGDELTVLTEVPVGGVARVAGDRVAEAVRRAREGEVRVEPGYDGVYGTVRLFDGP